MVTLLVVGGPFPPSPNYEQAPPRLTPRLQKTRPQAKAPTLTSGRRCRRRVSGTQPAGSLLFARSTMHDRCMRRRASPRLSSSPSQRTRDDRLSLPVRVAPAPTGSYPGSLAARTSTGSMTGGCASSSGAWAMSAAATRPPRWAWRPASSGKASKMPNSDGPRRIADQANQQPHGNHGRSPFEGTAATTSTTHNRSILLRGAHSLWHGDGARRRGGVIDTADDHRSRRGSPLAMAHRGSRHGGGSAC